MWKALACEHVHEAPSEFEGEDTQNGCIEHLLEQALSMEARHALYAMKQDTEEGQIWEHYNSIKEHMVQCDEGGVATSSSGVSFSPRGLYESSCGSVTPMTGNTQPITSVTAWILLRRGLPPHRLCDSS